MAADEALWKQIESYREAAIDMQRQLCAMPALGPENDGDGEAQKAEWILQQIQPWPFASVQLFKAPDARVPAGYRPNIVAILQGANSAKTLWIMSHMDVVPPGDLSKWSGDPWTMRIDGDKLIGRGTEDNQQGLVSSVFAVKAFVDLGVQPKINIGLLIVADEETGSKYGAQYLLEHHSDLFKKDDLFVIPDAGVSDGSMIEIAEKSILWLRIETIGRQTHASTPEQGTNAHKAAAELIYHLNNLYSDFSGSDAVFDPPISTFEPTKKEANVPNVNTIPGEDIFYFDCRILPQYTLDEVKNAVRRYADEVARKHGVEINISTAQEEQAAPPTPADAEVVKAIQEAMLALRGKNCTPQGIGGGTVAAFFRRAGYPAAVWSTIDDLAHEPDEYCKISNMLEDAKVFAYMASR